jgi:hypothetical protein
MDVTMAVQCMWLGWVSYSLRPSVTYSYTQQGYTQPWGEGGGPRLSLSLSLTLSLSFFLSSLKVVQRQDNGGVIDSKLTNGSSAREPVNNPPTFQCRTQDFQVAIPTLAKNQKAKGQMKVIKISVTLFCRVNRLLD